MSNAKPSFDDNWHPAYSEGSSWDGKALNLRVYNTMKYIKGKDELWPLPQSEIEYKQCHYRKQSRILIV